MTVLLSLLLPRLVSAQPVSAYFDSAFVHTEANRIEDMGGGLQGFYRKLRALEAGERRRLTIVHIGDSHLQEGNTAEVFRVAMQEAFGAAGRGLVFPYSVARTNGPRDLAAYSNAAWTSKRNLQSKRSPSTGISGFGMETDDPGFVLLVGLNDGRVAPGMDYRFNQLTLFHPPSPGQYDLRVSLSVRPDVLAATPQAQTETITYTIRSGDTLGEIAQRYGVRIADLRKWNNLNSDLIRTGQRLRILKETTAAPPISDNVFRDLAHLSTADNAQPFTTVRWDTTLNAVYLRGQKTQREQHHATLHGIVLEHADRRGVLYHGIGVNGAQLKHYGADALFWPQLAALKPDLIIVSLGTNESVDPRLDADTFRRYLRTFTDPLSKILPGVAVLFTIPPDGAYNRTNAAKLDLITEIMRDEAQARSWAVWDFRAVMGGAGGNRTWQRHGLAKRDGVHLTSTGYRLHGLLLYHALMRGYDESGFFH